jgi:hypothetical protein
VREWKYPAVRAAGKNMYTLLRLSVHATHPTVSNRPLPNHQRQTSTHPSHISPFVGLMYIVPLATSPSRRAWAHVCSGSHLCGIDCPYEAKAASHDHSPGRVSRGRYQHIGPPLKESWPLRFVRPRRDPAREDYPGSLEDDHQYPYTLNEIRSCERARWRHHHEDDVVTSQVTRKQLSSGA